MSAALVLMPGFFCGLQIYMESILGGGIAFATPEGEEMVVPARTGHRFIFQDKMDEDWLDWKSEIKLARSFRRF